MQSYVIIDSSSSKPARRYHRVTAKRYEALSPMDNDKASSPINKYEALLPMNKDKMSLSVDKSEVSSSLNKDKASSPINSEIQVDHRFAII